jgi:hypothetical protein
VELGDSSAEHNMGKTMAGQKLLVVRCLQVGVANRKSGKDAESGEVETGEHQKATFTMAREGDVGVRGTGVLLVEGGRWPIIRTCDT